LKRADEISEQIRRQPSQTMRERGDGNGTLH
jgi:hypothetical protein